MTAKKTAKSKVSKTTKVKTTVKVKAKAAKKDKVCNVWTTYRVTAATHKIGSDDKAWGGLHLYQVMKAEDGVWLHRTLAKNDKHESPGVVTLLTPHQAESKLELQKKASKAIAKALKSDNS